MRRCRFCELEIGNASTVCEHCGRSLIPGRPTRQINTMEIASVEEAGTSASARPDIWLCLRAAALWLCAWWTIHSALWLLLYGFNFATEPKQAGELIYVALLGATARNMLVFVAAFGASAFTIQAVVGGTASPISRRAERRIGFGLSLPVLLWLLASDLPAIVQLGIVIRMLSA